MKRTLTAHTLMILLTTALVAIFALSVGGFVFVRGYLSNFAHEVSEVASEAESSRSRVQQLQQTEKELAQYTEAINRAASLVAESKSYEYQNQIINDLTNYANRAGVSITSFSFSDSGSATGTPSAAPAAPDATGTAPVAPVASGLKSTSVVINLGSNVQYSNLLNFLSMIEHNLTKMQIANISITKSQDGGADSVSLQSLNLEVYIK